MALAGPDTRSRIPENARQRIARGTTRKLEFLGDAVPRIVGE